jgi:hypothetical protein
MKENILQKFFKSNKVLGTKGLYAFELKKNEHFDMIKVIQNICKPLDLK